MTNSIQATLERAFLRPQPRRFPAAFVSMLLLLGGLSVWTPMRADGQIFAITQVSNTSVLVGTRITIQISITNTTGATSALSWSLGSNPTTDASITPTNTGPQDSTIFTWKPTQAGPVTFTVSVTQLNSLNVAGMGFTVTATNSVTPPNAPSIGGISSSYAVNEGTLLQLYAYATNNDNTTNAIQFSLGSGAPSGAAFTDLGIVALITNATTTNGIFESSFNWTPSTGQAGRYTLSAIATETSASLSTSTNFTVNVNLTNNCEQNDEVQAAVASGGTVFLTACTNLVLTNTLIVTATNVTLDAAGNAVTITGNDFSVSSQ